MYRVVLFGGTTEGRRIAEFLDRCGISTHVCVATEYGEELLSRTENLFVQSERMDAAEISALLQKEGLPLVIDATHPYAAEVTKNIRCACEETGAEYVRLLRGEEGQENALRDSVYAENTREAVDFLKTTEGNILVTTGSKELAEYTEIPDYRERVFARVLSNGDVLNQCREYGFEGKNLISMQGPFSMELNRALIRQFHCRYLVTKMSGKAGGFQEKIEAIRREGGTAVIIGRPPEEEGISFTACKRLLCERFQLRTERQIALVGIGMGNADTMTGEALSAVREAELLIGARRMVEGVPGASGDVFTEYDSERIAAFIGDHPEYERIAILLSGDIGFYSGAKKLFGALSSYRVSAICGISSVVYFMGKLHKAWDDAYITSVHGREENLTEIVRTHKKVFTLLGSGTGVSRIAEEMKDCGLAGVRFSVGENLAYPEEKILSGTAEEFLDYRGSSLSVLYIENPLAAASAATHGIADREFLRGAVPMTKEEVRAVSLAKLRLQRDSVCWDIGAGTGSVSVEMALRATGGRVYAIEKNPEAVALLRKNREKFQTGNLKIVEGRAPEALENLERPTHGFIGGSAGNLREILQLLLEVNPEIRIVINCIAMETVAETLRCLKELDFVDTEIVQVSVSRAENIGKYHLMKGENPITIISCTGGKK